MFPFGRCFFINCSFNDCIGNICKIKNIILNMEMVLDDQLKRSALYRLC